MVVTAAAGYEEAQMQKAAGEANAQIAENNARLAEAAAQDAANQGARESQHAAWRTRALIGAQRASIAASGLDSELGTPFDLQGEAALFGGADKSAIAMNAARKAWGFGAEALNYRNQGAQAKWFGKTQSRITMLSTLGQTMTMAGGMGGGGASSGTGSSTAGFGASGGGYF
jgi:hypothetical protein